MTIFDALADAALFIAARRQAAHSKGLAEEKSWLYLRMLNNFVLITGQAYRFEDFLKASAPLERSQISARLGTHGGTFAQLAVELLLTVLHETAEPQQKQPVLLLISLINFVFDTGQSTDAEDFFINHLEYAPLALKHFNSHEEAEEWLRSSAEFPSPSYVLVGDEYHQFWYYREDDTRGMYREYPIESALEALTARGIPSQRPSFATRREAEDWLMSHPANPYSFVAIAGEHYFAVYHSRLNRHSLHHVASALKAWEEHKERVKREADQEEPE